MIARAFRRGALVVLFGALLLGGCQQGGFQAGGEKAPEISGEDMQGRPIKLSQFQGNVVLVDFWFTDCPPCRAEIPHERDLYRQYSGRKFAMLGISRDPDRQTLSNFLDRQPLPWPNIFDAGGRICSQWRVNSFPTFFLIDHKGVIRGKWVGGGQSGKIEAEVDKLVREAEQAN